MNQHVVWVKHFGYAERQECFTFNESDYCREEIEAMFVPYQFISKKGFERTGYEYCGEKYYDYRYLGVYPEDKIPEDDNDLWDFRDYRLDR